MNRVIEVDKLLENPYLNVVAHFSVALLLLVIFLALFERVTSYRTWEEIMNGNAAVAMSIGGKIFGICNVFRFAVGAGEDVYTVIFWGIIGFVLLVVAYFVFEFLTPSINVDKQLAEGNVAVGFLSLTISISLSYVIGASILG